MTAPAFADRPLPAWFEDAKLGIMLSWGPYSVPGWAPLDERLDGPEANVLAFIFEHGQHLTPYGEWYECSLAYPDGPTAAHHRDRWGDRPYADFARDLEAAIETWSPEPWADLCQQAGARYVVPLAKHHDGYLLYPSAWPSPHRPDWASPRDVIGELATAVRDRGLTFGAYYSGGIDWSYEYPWPGGPHPPGPEGRGQAYPEVADRHYRELIERYRPQVLWNDMGYPPEADAAGLLAHYYQQVPDGVACDRWGIGWGDFTTPEYVRFEDQQAKKWEMVRGVGLSFGFNQAETEQHTMTGTQLVHLLADVVAKGGNLMLGVGPDGAGAVSPLQERSLRELGGWLAADGEAIYGTRPWHRAEGRTDDGTPVRFTTAAGDLYAIVLGHPGPDVVLEGLAVEPDARVERVDGARPIPHRTTPAGTHLDLAPADRSGRPATAVRISPAAAARTS